MLVPMVSQAASLTTEQVNAIVGLLQSFGADQSVIVNVQMTLNGQKPNQPGNSGWHNDMGSSTWSGDASSTMPWGMPPGQVGKMLCITLSRNIGPGSQGDDVRKLQEMLAADPSTGFTASATGFFGPMTAKAMMHFQMNNGIASSSTGTVGPLTRGFFERSCGKGLDGMPGKPPMMGTSTGTTTH